MYDCLFKNLTEKNILHDKQFGFRNSYSTEHAIIELVDKLLSKLEKNRYTLGIFIDLSKPFDIVNPQILLKELKLYGVTGNIYS